MAAFRSEIYDGNTSPGAMGVAASRTAGAPILANRTLGYVVTMLNWSVAVGLVEQSPRAWSKAPPAEQERPEPGSNRL